MSDAWINKYIGIQYRPNGMDCYDLVRRIYREQLGIAIPYFATDGTIKNQIETITNNLVVAVEKGTVYQVDDPEDYDIVFVRSKKIAHHVGIYYRGGILHIKQDSRGCRYESLSRFLICNGGKTEFYRWRK